MIPGYALGAKKTRGPASLLRPPYRGFEEWRSWDQLPELGGGGWVAVWELGHPEWKEPFEAMVSRPGGMPLVLILPEASEVESVTRLLRTIDSCRPSVVLPYHERPAAEEMVSVLCRAPSNFSTEVVDYLVWRGVDLDPAMSRTIRRIVDLSPVVQTITALSRSLYISRRALGRRFLNRQLPVPSHWLHIARVLRAVVKLQNSDASLFSVACGLGYPDGFSLSNQMHRLCGIRPTQARESLGWEWVLEAWLMKELKEEGIGSSQLDSRSSIFSIRTKVEVGNRPQKVAEDPRLAGLPT